MSYATEALKTRSEKITLITVESVERIKLFTSSGSDWTRSMNYFVVGVKENGTAIDSWSYSPTTKILTIIGGLNPKARNISVTYRHFYSNAPIILPYDLSSGEPLEWEGRVLSIGSIGQQLDQENTGIVLESSSSVDLENTDGFFDSFFDTHIWENQSIKFYSWFPNIPISQKIQLFEGVIESKSFTDKRVTFRVKDFVYKLKNQVNLGVFTSSDGSILPSILNTPKRRIYGQADGVSCVSVDATLSGFLIGTVSGTLTSTAIVGASTTFLADVSPGDEIFVTVNDVEYKIGIESVTDDLNLVTTSPLIVAITAGTNAYCKPKYPYRSLNREWMIAGHKLRAASREILVVQSSTVFLVDSVEEFFEGDEIVINNTLSTVRRVSGSKIITSTAISPLPSVGDFITKRPIKKAYLGTRELVYIRDYVEVNTTSSCILNLTDLAEFNIAEQRLVGVDLVFTNGSNVLTTSDTIDLRTIIKPRDWIRSTNVARTDWYEVLDVSQQSIITRTNIVISGGPYTEAAYYKAVDVVDENSLVTVNCLGMESNSTWMKTASDSVRHLVLNDAGFSIVNESTFLKAKSICPYVLSFVIPKSIGQKSPLIRDVITDINTSVFGSLYGDSSQNISYSILNSTKPELSNILKDDDILSFSVDTNQKIANKVILKYRPSIDRFSGQEKFETVTHESEFVDDLIGISNTIERFVYLYETTKAQITAQRIALFNSLSSSTVKIKAKMNLAQVIVNDKIYLELDRLYSRYGGLDRRKLGTVTGVKRDGYSTELGVTDLGNIYNRVPSIAPASTVSYSVATDDEKIKWGYLLDDETNTPDITSEEGLGNYIIG